jgi:hypothetical protein
MVGRGGGATGGLCRPATCAPLPKPSHCSASPRPAALATLRALGPLTRLCFALRTRRLAGPRLGIGCAGVLAAWRASPAATCGVGRGGVGARGAWAHSAGAGDMFSGAGADIARGGVGGASRVEGAPEGAGCSLPSIYILLSLVMAQPRVGSIFSSGRAQHFDVGRARWYTHAN